MSNKKYYKYLYKHNKELWGIENDFEENVKIRVSDINYISNYKIFAEEISLNEYIELKEMLEKNNRDFFLKYKNRGIKNDEY